MSTWQAFLDEQGIPEIPDNILEYISDRERESADLMTCIDVCDAMARGIDGDAHAAPLLTFAVREAHDVAHVLLGGDRTMRWATVKYLSKYDDNVAYGPDWPERRRRMAELIERLEGRE